MIAAERSKRSWPDSLQSGPITDLPLRSLPIRRSDLGNQEGDRAEGGGGQGPGVREEGRGSRGIRVREEGDRGGDRGGEGAREQGDSSLAPPLRARGLESDFAETSRSGVRLGKVRGGSAELAVLPAAKKSRLCQRPAAIVAARCHGGQGTEAGWAIRRWWRSLRWDRCSRAGPNRRLRTRCYKLTSLLANNSTLPVPGRRRGR
jgi:hypothetical protein